MEHFSIGLWPIRVNWRRWRTPPAGRGRRILPIRFQRQEAVRSTIDKPALVGEVLPCGKAFPLRLAPDECGAHRRDNDAVERQANKSGCRRLLHEPTEHRDPRAPEGNPDTRRHEQIAP